MASLPLAMTGSRNFDSTGSAFAIDAPSPDNRLAGERSVAITYRTNLLLKLLGRAGWYVTALDARSGPFRDHAAAEQAAFYDRHYG